MKARFTVVSLGLCIGIHGSAHAVTATRTSTKSLPRRHNAAEVTGKILTVAGLAGMAVGGGVDNRTAVTHGPAGVGISENNAVQCGRCSARLCIPVVAAVDGVDDRALVAHHPSSFGVDE